jgi:hypothetical protein
VSTVEAADRAQSRAHWDQQDVIVSGIVLLLILAAHQFVERRWRCWLAVGVMSGSDGSGECVKSGHEAFVALSDFGALGHHGRYQLLGSLDAGDGEIIPQERFEVAHVGEPGAKLIPRLDGDLADVAKRLFLFGFSFFGELACLHIPHGGDISLPLFEIIATLGSHGIGTAEGVFIGAFDTIDGATEGSEVLAWFEVSALVQGFERFHRFID